MMQCRTSWLWFLKTWFQIWVLNVLSCTGPVWISMFICMFRLFISVSWYNLFLWVYNIHNLLTCFYCSFFLLWRWLKIQISIFIWKFRLFPINKINFVDQFWRGTLAKAKEVFSAHQPKGEITLLIEGMTIIEDETLSESELENELRELISKGHSLSMVMWSRLVKF